MKPRLTLLAALVLSSGIAFGYEDVTDNTGATEPPKGRGDNSFVKGVTPDEPVQRDSEPQVQNEPSTAVEEQVVEREQPDQATDTLSDTERQQVSQERRERYMRASQKGASLAPQEEQENQTAILILRYDQDQDGALSRDEIQNNDQLDNQFSDLDTDSDGTLSSEELSDWEDIDRIEE